MSDTSLRYISMLQLIPRYPRNVSTLDLQQKLKDIGFDINLRSIQRDLEKLSASFPLVCDENTKPFKWSYSEDSSVSLLPAMDIPSAITLELARSYLKPLLPPRVLDHLKPYFKEAQDVLKRNGKPISHWPQKIRFISRGFIGERPEINPEHLEKLAEAILKQEKCQSVYKARKWSEPETLIIHPLGLVYRDPNTYVLAEIEGRESVRQLSLHRFKSLKIMNENFDRDFNIDEFIDSGEMHILHSKKKINLSIICKKPMMSHLFETPIDGSQIISDENENQFKIDVDLPDSVDLRWWLIAQSNYVQIIKPNWLKDEIVHSLKQGIENQKA